MNSLSKRQISFKELKKYLYGKRKIMIVVLILAIVAGSVFSIVSKRAIVESNSNAAAQSVQSARGALSEADASYVDSSYKNYTNLAAQKASYEDELQNSILLNLNPDTSVRKKFSYIISGNKHADTIRDSMSQNVMNDTVNQAISNTLSGKPKIAYVKQLVEFTSTNTSSSNKVTVQLDDNESMAVLSVNIYARTSTELNNIKKIVNARIQSLTKTYQKSFGTFSCRLADETSNKLTDSDILYYKSEMNTSIDTVINQISTLKNSLSDDQRTYFDALVAANGQSATGNTVTTSISPKLVGTYGLGIGLIVLILYLIIMIIRYMTSTKLHYGLEMEQLFNAELIDEMNKKHDQNHVKKEFDYFINMQNGLIGVTGSATSDGINELIGTLSDNSKVIALAKNPQTDADYEQLTKITGVVLVEKDEVSDVREIDKMVEYYRKKNIPLIGSIVID